MTSKNHQKPPFRAEHMGSLLRPKALTDKRVALDDKKAVEIADDTELNHLEEEGVREIVKTQLDLGFHAINDGEYRRHQFWGNFFPGLEGFEEVDTPSWDIFRMYVPDIAAFSKSWPTEYSILEMERLTLYDPPQLRATTSPASPLSAQARSSTREAPI